MRKPRAVGAPAPLSFLVGALIAGATAGLIATTALAAPLEVSPGVPDRAGAPGVADAAMPAIPAAAAAAAPSLADLDGDGLSEGLAARLATLGPDERVAVIVTFDAPGRVAAAQAAVGPFAVHHEFRRIDAVAATMRAAQARALAGSAGVLRVEEDVEMRATMAAARRDFGVDRLRVAGEPTEGVSGAGIGVCVVDTGVNAVHEQFTDETSGASKIAGFLDLTGDWQGVFHDEPYDDNGHGTHVSSIATGDGTGASGYASDFAGVAPEAALYVVKVLNSEGVGDDSVVMQGVEWCADQPGVDVINLSLASGGSSDGRDALSLLVDRIVAEGIVVVAGAGNSGAAEQTIASPAAAAGAVTVGAVAEYSAPTNSTWYSAGMYRAPFSSRGPTKDGRIKPDIMAPGVTIGAAFISRLDVTLCDLRYCYVVSSGTSMASPFVAGTVALMLHANPLLSPNEVREILYMSARDSFPSAGKDNETGFGLLDAYAAVRSAMGLIGGETTFPADAWGEASAPDDGATIIPLRVLDPAKPLAVTVIIEGRLSRTGWSPDLEAQLLDADGNPFLVSNPLYPFLSSEPFIPAPGTSSTCPAGEECGSVGRQETVHIAPPLAEAYQLKVYGFDGWPNRGKGGNFRFEISNGTTDSQVVMSEPQGAPTADAGADQAYPDDGSGWATAALDGSNSRGAIAGYEWSNAAGAAIGQGMFGSVDLPLGTHELTLTVTDLDGAWSSDTVVVTVGGNTKTKGGGKPDSGGGGGNGKGGKNSR
jgi:serine protease AprX